MTTPHNGIIDRIIAKLSLMVSHDLLPELVARAIGRKYKPWHTTREILSPGLSPLDRMHLPIA